jgi:hypothetical protein
MIIGIDIGPTLQGVAFIYAGLAAFFGIIYLAKR